MPTQQSALRASHCSGLHRGPTAPLRAVLCQYPHGSRATCILPRHKLGGTYSIRRGTPGSDEPTCSLNQIYSLLGILLGLDTFIAPFVGCCHCFRGWGEERPRKVSPGFIQCMKLPLPAPPEPVAEALVACPSSDIYFFNAFPSTNIQLVSQQS